MTKIQDGNLKKEDFCMSKKIYVGNMNYATTEEEVESAFAQYGAVTSVKIITDRYTDKPRGFAFVEMEDDDAADAAISALNGSELGGRQLKVNEARERKPRPSGHHR